jgi:beta-glucanase (GH16 family)
MKNNQCMLLMTFLLLLQVGFSQGPKQKSVAPTKNGYKLVWSDEFDYRGLPDFKRWDYDTVGNKNGWGNHEAQYYTYADPRNAWVENGILTLTAVKEPLKGHKYTSVRLVTKNKGDWKYGRFEIKAKLPRGLGMWPAIWMLSTDWKYGGWPASGEIDIMENVGFKPDTIYGSIHTKSYYWRINTQKTKGFYLPDCEKAFHVYALEWDASQISFFVDDTKYLTFANEKKTFAEWPFDQRFHLLLNLAVGGDWGGQKGIDDTIFPQKMLVDYVRVYQKK